MAYHNIARHECGIHDVGRYKVDCFKERAADINQDCKVYTFRDLIQHIDPEMLEDSIWKDSVIICCADNRHCAYICNDLADRYNIPFIDAGCGPRASTGEVFYYKPNCNMLVTHAHMGRIKVLIIIIRQSGVNSMQQKRNCSE